MAVNQAPKAVNTYQYFFKKVLDKRLYYLFYSINGVIALVTSITLAIPYDNFWYNVFLTFIFRGPIIWLALGLIKQARYKFSTVEYSTHKTLASQIYNTISSFKFLSYSIFYILSAYFISAIFVFQLPFKYDYFLLSKEYRQKPLINDEWVYYWTYPCILALSYSLIHLTFQRNRLLFKLGHIRNDPSTTLLRMVPTLVGYTIQQNIVISVMAPIIYLLIKPIIYKVNVLIILILGLDTTVPAFRISLNTFFSLGYLSFHTIQMWEITNHAFNVYATIGCLDGNKPISTYSADPISTLLSGLRNVDPEYQLSRLTAFQELAYIATTNDEQGKKLRDILYNSRVTRGIAWPAILEECGLIIEEFTTKVNFRSLSDTKALKKSTQAIENELKNITLTRVDSRTDLFGNSTAEVPSTVKQLSNLRMYSTPKVDDEPSDLMKLLRSFKLVQSISQTFSIDSKKVENYFSFNTPNVLEKLTNIYKQYVTKFLESDFGIFFRVTVKRDSESRVINPSNYGNGVLAIANLAIHSVDEDKTGTISDENLCLILNLLERPIRASGNYTDYLPASIFLTPEQKVHIPKNHIIVQLHDLTMTEFYQLCIKFNYKLNNFALHAKTFRLAKKVMDVAIAEQEQQPIY